MHTVYNFNWIKSIPWLLLALGLATRLLWLGTPNSAVFDEVHFGKFISAYFTHQYYFDIHPPLGKLIIAGWGWLWGFRPGFSFANIGDVYPDMLYVALRFLPALAGAFLPVLVYGIARRLRMSVAAATLAGVFIALDNALLTQSRFILLDSFLLLFGFGAFYAYLRFRKNGSILALTTAGLLAGAAASIKWTGLSFLAVIGFWELITAIADIRTHRFRPTLRRQIYRCMALILIPILFSCAVFALHFALLTKSGAGDAFMSTRFQHGLAGSVYAQDDTLQPLSLPAKIVELNREMYRSNQSLTATHPYGSAWYTWPLMGRPIFYWVQDTARVYLIGNPIVWWLSTTAVLFALLHLLFGREYRRRNRVLIVLTGAWLLNMLPFIGIHRVMFLYHYFIALVWAVLILAFVVDKSQKAKTLFFPLAVLALILFIFFAPLTYGLPLSDAAYNARVWFSSWR